MWGESEDLRKLREEWPNLTYEEKVNLFLWKMVWYHHEKHIPGAPPHDAINRLADVVAESSTASEKLSNSIRLATWVAGIAAAVGTIVAIVALFL